MCLILFGYRTVPGMPLVVAANRDEFHQRAATSAAPWDDAPWVLAGRDLVAGGTWLGGTTTGRFAALTNFSGPDDTPRPSSRGTLVQDFLTGDDSAAHYAHHLHGSDYAGYNLLLFDGTDLVYTSNKGTTDILKPGYYGLSNAELGAEWPKCVQGAAALRHACEDDASDDTLLELLNNRAIPDDQLLPHRGRPIEFERRVAPCFIVGDEYGTRASTIVRIYDDQILLTEKTYAAGGTPGDVVRHRSRLE